MSAPPWAKKILSWILTNAAAAAALFVPAGRIDLPFSWGYLAVCAVLAVYSLATLDPGLARERKKPGPGGVDRFLRAIGGMLWIGSVLLASADVGRLHWSDRVPVAAQAAGLAVFAVGMTLVVWSVATNRFFSPVVRIQEERGHQVIRAGPYGIVRHPGYAGMLLGSLGSPVALGSWVALAPIGLFCLLIFRRILLEDRFLREHLDGYADYAREVRWRLVPGLW